MNSPTISIITVNFNDAKGLKRTIESVLQQTYPQIEYLVIDGHSTDGSKEVIKEYEDRITVAISEADSGIFNAMNKGLQHATGEFIQFLNSGDVFTSEMALADFVHHSDFQGDIIYGDYKFDKGFKVYQDVVTPKYLMQTSLPHQSTLFHKSVFEQMGGYDESYTIIADRVFYVACFFSGKFKFQHLSYALVEFDLDGISNAEAFKEKKKQEDRRMFEAYYGPHYEDYKELFRLERELSHSKRNTMAGILKRLKRKWNKLWRNP